MVEGDQTEIGSVIDEGRDSVVFVRPETGKVLKVYHGLEAGVLGSYVELTNSCAKKLEDNPLEVNFLGKDLAIIVNPMQLGSEDDAVKGEGENPTLTTVADMVEGVNLLNLYHVDENNRFALNKEQANKLKGVELPNDLGILGLPNQMLAVQKKVQEALGLDYLYLSQENLMLTEDGLVITDLGHDIADFMRKNSSGGETEDESDLMLEGMKREDRDAALENIAKVKQRKGGFGETSRELMEKVRKNV